MTSSDSITKALWLAKVEEERRKRGIELRSPAPKSLQEFMFATRPGYESNKHHQVLCQYLDRFVAGEIPRLMVFMPPRHGKSEHVSRGLPAYILGRNPDAQIIACSYTKDLAVDMNRDVQTILDTPEYQKLYPDTRLNSSNVRTVAGSARRNSDLFEVVGRKGRYLGTGVGGAITGKGMNYGIIDDVIKNRKEADSPTYRKMVWDWYTSTFRTRREKGASILVTLTRWHEDDLAGRLLKLAQDDPRAEQWVVLSLPAVCENPDAPDEYRQEGEPLWPSKFPSEDLAETQATLGSYEWNALYQQRPVAREGNMFKRDWFEFVDAAPRGAGVTRLSGWDLGGSDSPDADETSGALCSIDSDRVFYIEDIYHNRWAPKTRNAEMLARTEHWTLEMGRHHMWIEKVPGIAVEVIDTIVRLLAGYPVHTEMPKGDKVSRADPLQAYAEAGNVKLVRGPWNKAFLDQICGFPQVKHDDMVDSVTLAFNKLMAPKKKIGIEFL